MSRRGLTKVEVLVVIGVIAIAVALLVPSVERVREASARTRTNSHLKQCSLAVHNFHDTFKRLPDGFGPCKLYEDKGISLWFQLLPYLEADDVYKAAKTDAVVHSFLAPSDPFLSQETEQGSVNFAGNVRVFGYESLLANKQPVNKPGVALELPEGTLLSKLTLKEIADGTTNTIMMTTRYSLCAGQRTWYATDVFGKSDLAAPSAPGVGGFMGAGSHSSPPSRQDTLITAMFQIVPRESECLPQAGLFGHSFGTGGISTALCDGSVRNISPKMSAATFTRGLCPADANDLGRDWAED